MRRTRGLDAAPDAERVDLGGCCVVPGLADAHVHFPTWSLARRQVRLEGAHSLGVAASVQFSHAPPDRDLAAHLWEGRAGAYAYRSLLDAGALLANGSDAPVEELDPLAGIVAGVRRTLDERPPWRAEQAVTVEEALRAATVAPAWLEGQEHRRGTLLPGMLADLVVLDRDPLTCRSEELPEPRVLATMVGGRWTHLALEGPGASLRRSAARPSGYG